MIKILLAFLCLLPPCYAQGIGGNGGMGGKGGIGGGLSSTGFSIGNTTGGFNAGAGATFTSSAISVTAGQAIVVNAFACDGSGCSNASASQALTVTDSVSDTFNCPAGLFQPFGGHFVQGCWACNSSGGASVTFTITASNFSAPFYVQAGIGTVNGVAASSCGDTTTESVTSTTGTNPSITSGSVSQAGEFIFGGVICATACTAGQTDIVNFNSNQGDMQYTVGPSSGTQALTWTSSSNTWGGFVMGLKH